MRVQIRNSYNTIIFDQEVTPHSSKPIEKELATHHEKLVAQSSVKWHKGLPSDTAHAPYGDGYPNVQTVMGYYLKDYENIKELQLFLKTGE